MSLLKLYIENDDAQDEKPATVGVHDEKPAAIDVHDEKPAAVGVHDEKPSADGEFNIWETLPDEIVQKILLTTIKSSGYTFPNHVCDTHHAILGTCRRFHTIAKKGSVFLPRLYIHPQNSLPPSSYNGNITVSVR